jgi:hypothetical protein
MMSAIDCPLVVRLGIGDPEIITIGAGIYPIGVLFFHSPNPLNPAVVLAAVHIGRIHFGASVLFGLGFMGSIEIAYGIY